MRVLNTWNWFGISWECSQIISFIEGYHAPLLLCIEFIHHYERSLLREEYLYSGFPVLGVLWPITSISFRRSSKKGDKARQYKLFHVLIMFNCICMPMQIQYPVQHKENTKNVFQGITPSQTHGKTILGKPFTLWDNHLRKCGSCQRDSALYIHLSISTYSSI